MNIEEDIKTEEIVKNEEISEKCIKKIKQVKSHDKKDKNIKKVKENVMTEEDIKKDAEFKESIKHIQIPLLIIKYGNIIDGISWEDDDYSKKISELDTYDTYITTNEKFVDALGEKIEIDKITDIPNITIKKSIICEFPTCIYEMMYIDLEDVKNKDETKINNIATLLNTNGDIVYYHAILIKTNIETLSENMIVDNIYSIDIQYILYNRVHTNIIIYDTEWKSVMLKGSMEEYCDCFFEYLRYKKFEIKFLLHNINIWYIENKYDESICDNLINIGIDKCVIFIKDSPNIRGHITLEEVKKILSLSKVLSDYQVPIELTTDKRDNYGRNIIYNKYKILDYVYDKNINLKQ